MNLESLEGRQVLSGFAVSDTSAIEGSNALKFIDRFVAEGSGGLITPRSSIFGPDANHDSMQDLYVASANSNAVLRYDGVTGSFIDDFIAPGSGGLNGPADLAFGPDGKFYVVSNGGGQVLRYDGGSGAFIDVIASGLTKPVGITFGPDGSLYIPDQGANDILRYNGTGLSTFVSAGSGGLAAPRNAEFGPDSNGDGAQDLYVASQNSQQILRYDGVTGAFLGTFASTPSGLPMWLKFGTDGDLYVAARLDSASLNMNILRYDAHSGVLIDSFALGRDGWSFMVGPENVLYDSSNGSGNFVDRIGASSLAVFTVSLSSASASPVTVQYSTSDGTAIAGLDYVATSGTLTFAPGETSRTILVPTLNDTSAESAESFTLNLSNPVGATITDGQGIGTIQDDDATKFYVPNDASSGDRTYEYGALGASVENYAINSGNTAPRGATSTAAGTTVWVVDANKKVYVYNTSGGLLGSWTAGTLANNATVEGIATNGTDVWIVDAKQDKVFRYSGAASRLSGSQNATSSFSLNGANSNPKDIVTDGTYLWVVNDSTTDTVFKYTLTGSLLGSWTINGAGSSPTGITLDPTGGGALWIVDSGTDRVYQFDNARGLTTGSLSPSTSFALAAGNTNPQGIADPPVGALGSVVTPSTSVLPIPARRSAASVPATRSAPLILPSGGDLATLAAGSTPAGPSALRSRFINGRRRH